MKVTLEARSDDQIYWSCGDKRGEEMSGGVELMLTVPVERGATGAVNIPISIQFGKSDGMPDWSYELEVPEGSMLEPVDA